MRSGFIPKVAFVVLAVTVGSPTPLSAQRTTPRSPEVHEYRSPMILDYSLQEFFASGTGITTGITGQDDLTLHSCRGVSLSRFSLGFENGKKALKAVVIFGNNSGKDKKVTITFDLRSGERSLGSGTLRRLSIEQGDSGLKVVTFPVTLAEPITEPLPYLRITVELFDY